jgi:hypothetical protein
MMKVAFISIITFVLISGCISNPLTEKTLTGDWVVLEIGENSQTIQQYNVAVIQVGNTVKFIKDNREVGHGLLFNNTVTVTPSNETVWNSFPTFIITVVTMDKMEAQPGVQNIIKIDFQRLIH